ncbi:MAG: envelope stress response membrane protein PspB [Stellaceae bacterium]
MHVFGFILALIFLTVVAPIWIIAHYLARWRRSRRLSSSDEKTLAELYSAARAMEGRIATLERVLDADAPGWRTRTGA